MKLQLAILAQLNKPDRIFFDSGMTSFSFLMCFENEMTLENKEIQLRGAALIFLVLVTEHE